MSGLSDTERMRANRIELWRDQIRNAWGDDLQDPDVIVDSLITDVTAARAEQIAQQIEAFAADCKVSAHETDWDRGGQSALAAAARIARGQ